jgi:GNAT superfamily N-acetyltransferase
MNSSASDAVFIRPGTRQDIPRAWELICELALFERARDQVETTPEILERDGFGATPLFGLLVAELDGEVVGMALTYFRYSTWKGKRLYLEDLVVTESARGRGVGRALIEATIQLARETNCTGLMWQVLDCNKSAIEFYKRFDVRIEGEWMNVHFDLER